MTCKNSHTLISHGTRKGRALTLPLTCGNILSSLPWLISQLPLRKCGHLASEPAAARHRDPLGTRSEITPGSRAGVLAACLSAAFGLALATAADARAWLADGGWDRLDDWLAAHHGDGEDG